MMASPMLRRRGRPQSSSSRTLNRQCQFCEKNFSKTEHLLRHERSHTKERPFHCARCNKVYSRHDTLLRHAKSHDEDSTSSITPVSGMQENLQLNDGSNLQGGIAQDWHVQTQPLQHLGQMDPATSPLLNPAPFPTTNQSQDTQSIYAPPGTHEGASGIPNIQGPFSLPISATRVESPLSANNLWDESLMSGSVPWLIGHDFDLEALNTSVSSMLDISQPLFQPRVDFQNVQPVLEDDAEVAAEAQHRQKSATEKVRASWFNLIDNESRDSTYGDTLTGQMTPIPAPNQYDIGDNFRNRITARLRAPTMDDPLPSTKFLNLAVQVYFTKFNPIFPVIHSHTFRPSPKNSLLLLSITSIGSLLLGSKGATAQGIRIFERLNKAILASWEQSLQDQREAESMIEAALIGQTFGLLSGIPKHLAIVEAFHGTIIAWARRCKLFVHSPNLPDVANLAGKDLHKAWSLWARSEEIVRSVHGLYIHDAMLSRMLHHEPLLRHDAIAVPPAAEDKLFNAPTALAWKKLVQEQPFAKPALRNSLHINLSRHHAPQPTAEESSLKHSRQTAYVVLNGISAFVSEKQQMMQLAARSINFSMYYDALVCWYFTFADPNGSTNMTETSRSDVLLPMIKVLWHTVFMQLATNFNVLERAIGRDGLDVLTAEDDLVYAREWANSKEAQRCILHAYALLQLLGSMRLDTEPAIHIPHCLFLAGIASYSYTKFHTLERSGLQNPSLQTDRSPIDFPEFLQLGIPIPKRLFDSGNTSTAHNFSQNREMADGDNYAASNLPNRSRPCSDVVTAMMFSTIDLLQRIGHWGVARRYATTLSTLAKTDGDEDWMLILNDS